MVDVEGFHYTFVCFLFLSVLNVFCGVFLFPELLSFPSGIMVPRAAAILALIHLIHWARMKRNWSVYTN